MFTSLPLAIFYYLLVFVSRFKWNYSNVKSENYHYKYIYVQMEIYIISRLQGNAQWLDKNAVYNNPMVLCILNLVSKCVILV